MTASEFEREFDLLYNNIMSNAAPSIDSYEKSVFLTKAQEELVTTLYEGTFEGSERLTEYLNHLVVTKTFDSNKDALNVKGLLDSKSKAFEFPDDALYIVFESLKPTEKQLEVAVKPIKHDEYSRIRNNPFKKPRKSEALRITSNLNSVILEIISSYNDYTYSLRYIRKPNPIILYTEVDLTINSEDGTQLNPDFNSRIPCELNPALHRTILDVAVKMAADTYK